MTENKHYREVVLKKYKDADSVKQPYYGWTIVRRNGARLAGNWGREEYAWEEAASRIEKKNQ